MPTLSADSAIGVIYKKDKETLTLMHHHLFNELAIIISGTGIYKTPHNSFELHQGDVFMLKPYMKHEYFSQKKLEIVNIVYFADRIPLPSIDFSSIPEYQLFFELEPQTREQRQFANRLNLSSTQLDKLLEIISHLKEEIVKRKIGYEVMTFSYLYQIFTYICRCYSHPSDNNHHELICLEKIISYMQKNYAHRITRAHLAEISYMSEPSLYRKFKLYLNKTPIQYLIDLRLKKAVEMLVNTNETMTNIAILCGFSDSNYFILQFKKRYGTTPYKYRKTNCTEQLKNISYPENDLKRS